MLDRGYCLWILVLQSRSGHQKHLQETPTETICRKFPGCLKQICLLHIQNASERFQALLGNAAQKYTYTGTPDVVGNADAALGGGVGALPAAVHKYTSGRDVESRIRIAAQIGSLVCYHSPTSALKCEGSASKSLACPRGADPVGIRALSVRRRILGFRAGNARVPAESRSS